MTTIDLRSWLGQAVLVLKPVSEQPRLEAEALLAGTLGKTRTWVAAHPEEKLGGPTLEILNRRLRQLASGVPLPYITGHQEFYGLDFEVSPDVLIPRPETELLVEEALNWLKAHPDCRRAADVGVGSGCISVSLAKHITDLQVVGVDISEKALQMAQKNVIRHAVSGQVELVRGDLFSGLAGPFNLVCANLPYIPSGALAGLEVKKHEPLLALDGGLDGMDLIRRLAADLPQVLAPNGLALLEIEEGQENACLRLGNSIFAGWNFKILKDLSGHSRVWKIISSRG